MLPRTVRVFGWELATRYKAAPQRSDFATNYVATLSSHIKWKLYRWEYTAGHIVH